MKKRQEKRSPGAVRIAGRILAGILAALLLFLLGMFLIPLAEGGDKSAVEGSADWMGGLDDGAMLDEIVLPGTHDSATQYCQLAWFSKCQFKTVGEQLEAGYRYLDIRLAVDGEDMRLMHGFTQCRKGAMPWSGALELTDLLEDCYVFLAQHPTETILFAVKQEHGDESVEQFQRTLDAIVQREPAFWLLTDEIPSLGEARGKLVLLRRYEDEAGLGTAAGIPLLWANQNGYDDYSLDIAREEQGSYSLFVQDRYEYPAREKWAAFVSGMEKATTGEGNVAIHFLSTKGTAAFGHPYGFAKELDARLLERQELAGWIVVDYASAPLAEHIYRVNFR